MKEAGRIIIKVDPRFTSQVCSNCGQVRKKELSERWHSCDCGAELDRDVNAAINILERGKHTGSDGANVGNGVEASPFNGQVRHGMLMRT